MNNKEQIGIGILNKQHLKDNAIIQNYAYGGSLSLLEGSTINKQKYTQSLPSVRYADGGDTKLEWSGLSITDKAPWIRFLVSKGITSAKGMENAYNKYVDGGDKPTLHWPALQSVPHHVVANPNWNDVIETFAPNDLKRMWPGIDVTEGYYAKNPYPGENTIMYNPNDKTVDLNTIALDGLHFMRDNETYRSFYNDLLQEMPKDPLLLFESLINQTRDELLSRTLTGEILNKIQNNLELTPEEKEYFYPAVDGYLRRLFAPDYMISKTPGDHGYDSKYTGNADILNKTKTILDFMESYPLPEVTVTPNGLANKWYGPIINAATDAFKYKREDGGNLFSLGGAESGPIDDSELLGNKLGLPYSIDSGVSTQDEEGEVHLPGITISPNKFTLYVKDSDYIIGDAKNILLRQFPYWDYDTLQRFLNIYDLAGQPGIKSWWSLPEKERKQNMNQNGTPRALIRDEKIEINLPKWGGKFMKNVRNFFGIPNNKTVKKPVMYINDIDDVVAELAHPILKKYGNNGELSEAFGSIFHGGYDGDNDPRGGTRYMFPDRYEGETHSYFEPILRDYLYWNLLPDSYDSFTSDLGWIDALPEIEENIYENNHLSVEEQDEKIRDLEQSLREYAIDNPSMSALMDSAASYNLQAQDLRRLNHHNNFSRRYTPYSSFYDNNGFIYDANGAKIGDLHREGDPIYPVYFTKGTHPSKAEGGPLKRKANTYTEEDEARDRAAWEAQVAARAEEYDRTHSQPTVDTSNRVLKQEFNRVFNEYQDSTGLANLTEDQIQSWAKDYQLDATTISNLRSSVAKARKNEAKRLLLAEDLEKAGTIVPKVMEQESLLQKTLSEGGPTAQNTEYTRRVNMYTPFINSVDMGLATVGIFSGNPYLYAGNMLTNGIQLGDAIASGGNITNPAMSLGMGIIGGIGEYTNILRRIPDLRLPGPRYRLGSGRRRPITVLTGKDYDNMAKYGAGRGYGVVDDYNDTKELNRWYNEEGKYLNTPGSFLEFNSPMLGGSILHNDGGNLLDNGGGIHIDPENKGKFNETKKRTGKTTEELTHSSNPLTRKRAIFALNAKKWKHDDGGNLFADAGQLNLDDDTITLVPNTNWTYLVPNKNLRFDPNTGLHNVYTDLGNYYATGTLTFPLATATGSKLTDEQKWLNLLFQADHEGFTPAAWEEEKKRRWEEHLRSIPINIRGKKGLKPTFGLTGEQSVNLLNNDGYMNSPYNDKLQPYSTSTSSSAFLILEPEMQGLYDRMDFDDWAKKTFTDNGIPFKVVDNGGNSFYAVTGDPNNPFTRRYYYNLDISQEEIDALKMQASMMDPSRLGYIIAGPSEEELMLRRVLNTLASMDGMTLGINNVPDNMRSGMVATNANLYYMPAMLSPGANIGFGALTGYELKENPYWVLKTADYLNNGLYGKAAFSALGDASYGAIGILPAVSDLARVSEAGVGTVLRAAETMDNAVGDAARTINSNYYKPWQLGKTIDNVKLEINPNSRLYTTTPNSSTSWNYHAFTSDGHPVGEGTLNSSFNGEGNQIGWIQNTSRGSESGASRTIYNAMINDSKATGEPGIISGEYLLSPEITENVTADFPHTVIREGDWAYPLSGADPYRPEVRLLTGTNGEVPRYTDPSIIDRHLWFPEKQAPGSMVFDGTVYPPEQLRRVWKDNRYQWEPIIDERTTNWYDWANRAKEPTGTGIDNAYMKAVQEGDMGTALALRDLHFVESALNPTKMYTASKHFNFDTFEPRDTEEPYFHFGDEATAADVAAMKEGSYKPFFIDKGRNIEMGDAGRWNTLWIANKWLDEGKITLEQWQDIMHRYGHYDTSDTKAALLDALNFANEFGFNSIDYLNRVEGPGTISTAVVSPNQIKSADAVTYFKANDPEVLSGLFKAGDPIPLSMRDDFSRSDIRFDSAPSLAEYVTPQQVINKLELSGWKPFGKYRNASEYYYSLSEEQKSSLARDLFPDKLTSKMQIIPYTEEELALRALDMESLPYGTPNWQGDSFLLTKTRLENGGFDRIESAVNEYIDQHIDDLIKKAEQELAESKKAFSTKTGRFNFVKGSAFDEAYIDYLRGLKENGFRLSDLDKEEILNHLVIEVEGKSHALGKTSTVTSSYKPQHKADIKGHEFTHVIDAFIHKLRAPMESSTFDASGTGHYRYMTQHLGTEQAARMNQLKNYFGLSEDLPLTKEHIEYARKYFVRDRGYDNNMQAFLDALLDPEKAASWGLKWAPVIMPAAVTTAAGLGLSSTSEEQ